MQHPVFNCATVAALSIIMLSIANGQSTVKDCDAVLAKDYYAYAEKVNLKTDFLRSIDSETWQELRKNQSTGVSLFDVFSFSDDYSTFSQKRTKYFETVHYSRSEDQARSILRIATAERAYPAFEMCLQTVGGGPALRVWASRETMDEIDLRVRYVNPAGVKSMTLEGFLENGSVAGAPAGSIWKGKKKWGVNQEFPFVVKRAMGVANTKIVVTAADGSTPVLLNFERADATLLLTYNGTVDVLRQWGMEALQHTPNNDHNRGHCPNEVGHQDGKWCISRTTVTLPTQSPFVLKNPRSSCRGGGCPWSSSSPVSRPSETSASFYLDNWGSAVDAVLNADLYERVAAANCGGDGPIPVTYGQAVVFAAPKECLSLASVKWKLTSAGSEGVVRYGENSSDKSVAMAGPPVDNNTVVQIAYKVTNLSVPAILSTLQLFPSIDWTDEKVGASYMFKLDKR
jgi:hypothetical protein